MTNVKLELLTSEDSEIMLMFTKAKQNGISCTGSSKFFINTDCNPELKQNLYDKCFEKGLKSIGGFNEYYGVNSLYAWAMRNKLPVRNFRFIDPGIFINELRNMVDTYNWGSDHNHRCEKHIYSPSM